MNHDRPDLQNDLATDMLRFICIADGIAVKHLVTADLDQGRRQVIKWSEYGRQMPVTVRLAVSQVTDNVTKKARYG